MEKIEVEQFSGATNAAVVRLPGRAFPGIVIQGDSLANLFHLAQSLVDRTRDLSLSDVEDEAVEIRDLIWGYLGHYERVIREAGFTLPFDRTAWPK